MCYIRSTFWSYRVTAVDAAIAYDNIKLGREDRSDKVADAIKNLTARMMEFVDDETPSPTWVCFYDEVLDPPSGATVNDLRQLVRKKVDEMREKADPVALMKFCLKLHDLARD